MDMIEKLRLTNLQLAQEAANEIEWLRDHAVKMRQVCQELAERLHAIDPASNCGEEAEIAWTTLH